MAINEACQVWIEQRIKEELETKDESGKSLRAIGRELAAEIERIFEAKVDFTTLGKRAARMWRETNVSSGESPTAPTVANGDSGDKIGPAEVIDMMGSLIKSGKSSREAADIVADKCGEFPAKGGQGYGKLPVKGSE